MKFKKESAFQAQFKKWALNNITTTTVIELKLVKDGKFKISTWISRYTHQVRGLMQAKKDGVYHKISDGTRDLKPFDCFFIKNANAFLVVYFNEFEKFIFIDIEEIFNLHKKQKSATFFELSRIGKVYSF